MERSGGVLLPANMYDMKKRNLRSSFKAFLRFLHLSDGGIEPPTT